MCYKIIAIRGNTKLMSLHTCCHLELHVSLNTVTEERASMKFKNSGGLPFMNDFTKDTPRKYINEDLNRDRS